MSNQYTNCDKEKIIRQLLKVQAQITVTPQVKHGIPKVYCIKSNIKPNSNCYNHDCYDCDCDCCDCDCCDCCGCDSDYNATWESGGSKHRCNFTLTQVICVEIPISIDTDVDIDEGIICCSKPEFKSIDDKNKNKQFCMQIF